MLRIYGIKNCDTVKKALNWLDENHREYEFVDFKKHTPTQGEIQTWKKAFGDWPVNTKGRTFKMIKDDFENADTVGKMKLIQEKTSVIKRPIIAEGKEVITFGFDEEDYAEKLS